jgi:hypothetical protein
MIATKITVGAFVAVALAKSYFNVWGVPNGALLVLSAWGAQ